VKVVNDAALQQALQSYGVKQPAASEKTSSGDATNGAGSRGDQISISTEGQELQRAIRAAQQADEVRAERVAELRTSLRSGKYLLNPQQIADRMLGVDGSSSQ
jgi:flagellar biosynthesis anti-sigma factor FlgM